MRLPAILILTCLAAPAGAQTADSGDTPAGLSAVPEGCEAVASVAKSGCRVSIIMQCGAEHMVQSYVDGEAGDSHLFGANWDLLSYNSGPNDRGSFTITIDPSSGPGLDLARLIESGEDRTARKGTFSTPIIDGRAIEMEVIGTLRDETLTLNGVELRRGTAIRRFIVNRKNPALDAVFELDIYVSGARDLFIEGTVISTLNGKTTSVDIVPTAIFLPGQDGFGALRPAAAQCAGGT